MSQTYSQWLEAALQGVGPAHNIHPDAWGTASSAARYRHDDNWPEIHAAAVDWIVRLDDEGLSRRKIMAETGWTLVFIREAVNSQNSTTDAPRSYTDRFNALLSSPKLGTNLQGL